MSCLRVILTCLTSLCPLLALLSQPVCTVTRYDESSGLSQWRVTQMLQDQDGMMWMATWNGLDRFDGLEFTNFKSRPGDGCAMPSDRIRDLRQTADGSLFCLAEQTWYRFDRNSGSFFTATADQAAWLVAAAFVLVTAYQMARAAEGRYYDNLYPLYEHIGLGGPAKHHFTVMQIPAVRAFVASVTLGAL